MIIGIGNDIVSIQRVTHLYHRYDHRFIQRILADVEQEYIQSSCDIANSLAKRFAAKEACFKAIGTGLRWKMSWHDIIIHHNPLGKPYISIHGATKEYLNTILPAKATTATHLSLSDEHDMVFAVVLLECLR